MLRQSFRGSKRISTRALLERRRILTRRSLHWIVSREGFLTSQNQVKKIMWANIILLNTFHQTRRGLITSLLKTNFRASLSNSWIREGCNNKASAINPRFILLPQMRDLIIWVNRSPFDLWRLSEQIPRFRCHVKVACKVIAKIFPPTKLARSISEETQLSRIHLQRGDQIMFCLKLKHFHMRISYKLKFLFHPRMASTKRLRMLKFIAQETYKIFITLSGGYWRVKVVWLLKLRISSSYQRVLCWVTISLWSWRALIKTRRSQSFMKR